MKEILIFAGTTEGRRLSECLAGARVSHTVCVATEYGEIVMGEHPYTTIHQGRMNLEEMKAFLQEQEYAAVVDATHPYATEVTQNIRQAALETGYPYLRLQREMGMQEAYEQLLECKSNEECVEKLKHTSGNILLTTGSKELFVYANALQERLYVRVLPGMESIRLCEEQNIAGRQIIAMQGPFTTEMNEAVLRQFHISCLVTKKSGRLGGFQEKIEAARRVGIPVYVIGNESKEEGLSFREVCSRLEAICGKRLVHPVHFEIQLAGVGMGTAKTLTEEVRRAIEQADYLLGAKRMIADFCPKIEKKPYYTSGQIIPYLKEIQSNGQICGNCKVVVLFSGDSGFYSGSSQLYRDIKEECEKGNLQASIHILPGISSVSYLASCVGVSYEDAAILSMHGKTIRNLAKLIGCTKKTFLLLSGAEDVRLLGAKLTDAGLFSCTVIAGYQLSYPEEEIRTLTPEECMQCKKAGLYVCLILNPDAKPKHLTHGMGDEVFIRDKVPMTKEEVREVSICKLHLFQNAIVYDIGSGTGSIAVEIAALSDTIQVYAIEQKEAAADLIAQNGTKAGLENIEIIRAKAPQGLSQLPVPTHAFIGGSGGNLKEILRVLYEKNPAMRVVINAISLETICELRELVKEFPVENEEIVQMQISRASQAGSYHLMRAENPVWICAFQFRKGNVS